jgi:hypothetical protein
LSVLTVVEICGPTRQKENKEDLSTPKAQQFSGIFIFGVLHPVARILSMLLEEPSLATTLQGVYFTYFCHYMFWPKGGSSNNLDNLQGVPK